MAPHLDRELAERATRMLEEIFIRAAAESINKGEDQDIDFNYIAKKAADAVAAFVNVVNATEDDEEEDED